VPTRVTAGHNIGDLLLREGLITNSQLDLALERQRQTDQPLVRILVESGALDETRRLNFFKRQFGVPLVSLANLKIDQLLYTYIPPQIARKNHLVPIKLDRDGLVVAMEDPSDLIVLDNLKEIVGLRIKPVIASSSEIVKMLEGYPEEKVAGPQETRAAKFDFVVAFLSYAFLPLMSAAVLGGIILLILFSHSAQLWLRNQLADSITKSSEVFTLFLYFFLTWGVWTIIMYEIRGLVFDDLTWADDSEVGEPKYRGKALVRSIFLGWLGLDRFYLGYKRMGILKLCTLGLLGIWWILDAIELMMNRMPDAAGRSLR
jgi:hypothetical protein